MVHWEVEVTLPLPTPEELLRSAEKATEAGQAAEELRAELRWSAPVGDLDRERRIEFHLEALADVMAPLRSAIGRFAGGWAKAPDGVEDVLRTASAYVQYQRKQLKKMRA